MTGTPKHNRLSLREDIVPPVQFVGFWIAVLTPFVLLGLIFGEFAAERPLLLVGLFAANVAAIVIGHGHNR